ncbi:MAG TPA: hypothetical protein VKB86_05800 [Pyrinomonadaceae bacterium]|nr:hypothetical protein [Pyrinomonadaceae bacterium]
MPDLFALTERLGSNLNEEMVAAAREQSGHYKIEAGAGNIALLPAQAVVTDENVR